MIFTVLLSLFWLLPDHALYLGVIEVELGKSGYQVEIKVFTNDLEDALNNAFHQRIPLAGKDLESVKVQLTSYFDTHFKCGNGSLEGPLTWEGYQTEGDATWLRFSIAPPLNTATLSIRGDFLMELFPTQINVLKITKDRGTKTVAMARLTKSSPVYQLDLMSGH